MTSKSLVFVTVIALAFGGVGTFIGFCADCAEMLGEPEINPIGQMNVNTNREYPTHDDFRRTLWGSAIGLFVFLIAGLISIAIGTIQRKVPKTN